MENEMIVIDLSEKTARPPLKFITHVRTRCATPCPITHCHNGWSRYFSPSRTRSLCNKMVKVMTTVLGLIGKCPVLYKLLMVDVASGWILVALP